MSGPGCSKISAKFLGAIALYLPTNFLVVRLEADYNRPMVRPAFDISAATEGG